jgi:sirohydrochlorin ferrochelatase
LSSDVLFVLHGSPDPAYAQAAASFMQAWQRYAPAISATLCFLEHQPPLLSERMQQADVSTCVVPLFLNRGGHVRRDIPHLVAGRAEVRVTEALTDADAICAVMLARLEALSHTIDYLLLYSHGSREDRATVAELAGALRAHQPLPVDVVLASDGEPGLAAALQRAAAMDAAAPAILPHFLFDGRWRQRLMQQLEVLAESQPFERVEIAAPLGEHPAMFALIERRIDQCRI